MRNRRAPLGLLLAGAVGICASALGTQGSAQSRSEAAAVLGAACRDSRPYLIEPRAPALGVAVEPLSRAGDLTDLEDTYPRLLRELAKVVGSERDARVCLEDLVDRQGKVDVLPEVECGSKTVRLGQPGLGHREGYACSNLNDFGAKTLGCWGVMYLSMPGYCSGLRFAVALVARLDMSSVMDAEGDFPWGFAVSGAVPLPSEFAAKAVILAHEGGKWIVKKVVQPCDWPPRDRRLEW